MLTFSVLISLWRTSVVTSGREEAETLDEGIEEVEVVEVSLNLATGVVAEEIADVTSRVVASVWF